jgi:hypothetical protein
MIEDCALCFTAWWHLPWQAGAGGYIHGHTDRWVLSRHNNNPSPFWLKVINIQKAQHLTSSYPVLMAAERAVISKDIVVLEEDGPNTLGEAELPTPVAAPIIFGKAPPDMPQGMSPFRGGKRRLGRAYRGPHARPAARPALGGRVQALQGRDGEALQGEVRGHAHPRVFSRQSIGRKRRRRTRSKERQRQRAGERGRKRSRGDQNHTSAKGNGGNVQERNEEGESGQPQARVFATGTVSRRSRTRTPSPIPNPGISTVRGDRGESGGEDAGKGKGDGPQEGIFEKEDYITLVDPKHFSVKALDIQEKNVKYREWAQTVKRFIKGRPGTGKEAHKAVMWAGKNNVKSSSRIKFCRNILMTGWTCWKERCGTSSSSFPKDSSTG